VLKPADGNHIAREFGLGDDVRFSGPAARGELGQIWRLETGAGAFAVKEWFGDAERGELLEGAAFQEMAARDGITCPRVVRRTDGSLLTDVSGTTVAVYGWVDVLERDPTIDPAGVGALVGALHRVPFAGQEPVHPWYMEPVGRDRWDELVLELRRGGAPFADELADLRDELVGLEEVFVPPGKVRTCHRDLWADNLRATAEGSLCLIDWDNAGHADPSGELAQLLFEFARGDAERARSLHDAYLDAGGPGRVRDPGDFTMPIAMLGHIGERACVLWLTAENDEDREHAAGAAWEFVGEPLTRTIIDDLLDAIS
jgi:Ser/Thr protein kinase RdoA (MazF antagonist)